MGHEEITEWKGAEMSGQYILNESGKPVPEPDLMKWGTWFQTADRQVAVETIGESKVSTIFLGLDHAFGGQQPVLWETMVFGGKLDQAQDRCGGSREQAEAMHARMVKRVQKKVKVRK